MRPPYKLPVEKAQGPSYFRGSEMFEIVRPAPHKRVDAIGYFCNGEVSQFWEVQGANKGTHSFERPTYAHG